MQDISWGDGGPVFDISNVTRPGVEGIFGGIVLNATWAEIQQVRDGGLDFARLDDALQQVRTYNAANPTAPLAVKLRLYQGNDAPEWAKEIDKGPVSILRNSVCGQATCPPVTITVGKVWSADYINAWTHFLTRVANHYDAEPLIHAVAVTSCAMQTDEPFVPTGDSASRQALFDAGYTDQAEMDCLSTAIDNYSAFQLTLIDYTFNVFTSYSHHDPDAGLYFTESVMQGCRSALGSRCVWDNHALSDPPNPVDQPVYDAIAGTAAQGPINFQTASPVKMECEWTQTIAYGAELGASAIEVWPNFKGFNTLPPAAIQVLADELAAPVSVPAVVDGGCCGFDGGC